MEYIQAVKILDQKIKCLETSVSECEISCDDCKYNVAGAKLLEALKIARRCTGAISQIQWERDIAIQQLAEIGLGLGEKVDHVKEAIQVWEVHQKEVKLFEEYNEFLETDGGKEWLRFNKTECDGSGTFGDYLYDFHTEMLM